MILGAEDILAEYRGFSFKSPKEKPQEKAQEDKTKISDIKLTGDCALIYDFLTETPVHISQIEAALSIPTRRILAAVTELELNQMIISYSGRRYSKSNAVLI